MKKTLVLVMIILLVVMSACVYAAPAVTVNLTTTATKLTPGEEVEITFSVGSITGMEEGLETIQGTLEYDTNIFETITENSVKNMNEWSISINPDTNIFAGTNFKKATSGGIFTITLKVKEGVTAKSTTVSIKDIKTTDSSNDDAKVDIAKVSVTIGNANDTPSNNNNVVGNTVGNTTENTAGNNASSNVTNTNKADNTLSSTKLPKTGITPYVIIALVVVAVIATVSVIRYKNIMK